MSEKKPVFMEPNSKVCPVCGKRSYSLGGIHPQCSMLLADAPRAERLVAEKKAKAKAKENK